ncbi:MAG: DUF6969 family protein [Pseudomonadota bacterium]
MSQALDRIDRGELPVDWVDAAFAAMDEWSAIQRALVADGQTILTELFRDHADNGFGYWEHFPADDALDAQSGARFYYHAHDPAEWSRDEHGHFHLFLPAETDVGFAHVVAVSMTPDGMPQRLFTTNEWVTGEKLLPAYALLASLPGGFEINRSRPSWLVGRWLGALVALAMPLIEPLLAARDEALTGEGGVWPASAVTEDRGCHVLSECELDIRSLVSAWERRAAALVP